MDMYLSTVVWLGTSLFAIVIGIIVTLLSAGIATLALYLPTWAADAMFKIKIRDVRISDNGTIWTTVMCVMCLAFMPLGGTAMSAVYRDMSKRPPTVTEVRQEVRAYHVVSYTNPKHVYVTLKDANNGMVYERQYVSTYCTIRVAKNETVNIPVSIRYSSDNPDFHYLVFLNFSQALCE